MKIFYSWQSDLPNNCNRGFIEDCIKRTVRKYKDIISIEADRDVQNNTGSPDIANTIFDKIDECDLFIADISIINKSKCRFFRGGSRPTPNPNVLLELGYAAATLGWERIVCIYNTDFSDLDALPFDLRQHRITSYSLTGKEKSTVRTGIVDAISATINGLVEKGSAVRPKGSRAYHQVLGFDSKSNSVKPNIFLSKIDYLGSKQELVEIGCQLVEKLNASNIRFTGGNEPWYQSMHINLDESIKEIGDEEKAEVTAAVKSLLGLDLSPIAFRFGDLQERRDYLQGGYRYDGTDEEKEKHQNYLLLKRLLTEITVLELFCKPFEGVSVVPLAIKNISSNLDRNINVTVTVEGDDFELITPTAEWIGRELRDVSGFACHYGFISNAFSMKETPEIKFDEIEVYDHFDDNPRMNFWDGGTSLEAEDFIDELCDYVAVPSAPNVVEFKVKSLQANETKWLSHVILVKIRSGKIKLKYSIRSDNTDGSVVGEIVL